MYYFRYAIGTFTQPPYRQISMPVLIVLAPIFLFIPGATAFFAQSLGRNFWIWFALGFALPVISFGVLWFLPEKPVVPSRES